MPGEPILIVDDNPTNLKLLMYLLTAKGYQARTAKDAEEALVMLQTFRPRLLLLDLQLPGMDGLTLARSLRADSTTRDLVIVAVTAHAMKGDEEAAIEAGCDGFVTKPIDTRDLPRRIAEYLARSTEDH
ncbi:MAG: two-component hybrid sensor and regulator [Myxococcales bacterium]|nr:two-component hybrid sensor and regulator [Myxococcales bacterium]